VQNAENAKKISYIQFASYSGNENRNEKTAKKRPSVRKKGRLSQSYAKLGRKKSLFLSQIGSSLPLETGPLSPGPVEKTLTQLFLKS